MNYSRLLLVLLLALAPTQAQANDLEGYARVLDGDTLQIRKFKIRFSDIDAPEAKQMCRKGGIDWPCGKEAALALRELIGKRRIQCHIEGIDRYDRLLALCHAGGVDLNETMVRTGWAVAYRRYSERLVPTEEAARTEGLGIWSGSFDLPEDWRHRQKR